MRSSRAARVRFALASALVLAALAALTAGAGAQEGAAGDGARVVLRRVDATAPPAVEAVVSWSGGAVDAGDVVVVDGDDEPEVTVAPLGGGVSNDIYLVVDTSTSGDVNNLVSQSRRAIEAFLADGIPPGTRMALLRAGSAVQTMEPLTSDPQRILDHLDALSPEGEGAVLNAVAVAGGQAARRIDRSISTVVLLTDGVTDSQLTGRQAAAQLRLGAALLHVIALDETSVDRGLFSSLTQASGGSFRTVAEATDLTDALSGLRPELVSPSVVRFSTAAQRGPQDLTVTVGGASATGSYILRQTRNGFQNLQPIRVIEAGGHGIFGSGLGKVVGLTAGTLAIAMFAYATILIFVRQEETLTTALRPYGEAFGEGEPDDVGDGTAALAQTALLQRAVAATESFAERRGLLDRVERALEKAGAPLRAGEAMFFYLAGALLLIVLAAVLSRNVVATVLVGVVAVVVPPALLNVLAATKKRKFEALLPDTLQLLSSTLRAGYSMMQGVEAVAQEAAEPMGAELRRVVTEARLGRPVESALDAAAERMDSRDFAWAVMAIRIQREVGGNLSELLLTVAETMTQRERLRRDVRALTAEGRISAWVLVALPIALGLFLYTTNPQYIGRLFASLPGQLMLGGGILAMLVGTVWMMKIIDIEV